VTDDEVKLAKVAAEAGMKPLADLMSKMFGGAVEQIGGIWTDALAARRFLRREKLIRKVAEKSANAGFEPTTVSDKIWMPIVQEALKEDDETLQDMWANLLANAADPRKDVEVLPSFSSILKELTPRDALGLNRFYDNIRFKRHIIRNDETLQILTTEETAKNKGIELPRVTLTTLQRNGLLVERTVMADERDRPSSEIELQHGNSLTELGAMFVRACREPKKTGQ
jgi:hypothetical protein